MDTTPPSQAPPPPPDNRCPGCGWYPLAPAPLAACPRCALPLTGELVAEVREIDAALVRLDAERGRLLARRWQLLTAARPRIPVPAAWGPGPARAREASPRAAQNLLLALGGVLLAVAAMAFTVVSWGLLGIGGRAVVLGVLTAAVVAAPALLLRRSLNATGEAVACVGLVLLLLDAYAIRQVAMAGTDGVRYAAVSLAAVSALWALYGRLPAVRRLTLPAPAALLLAQLPLPLLALGGTDSGTATWTAAALLATAGLDTAVVALSGTGSAGAGSAGSAGAGPVGVSRGTRTVAAVAGSLTGLGGLLIALALSVTAGGYRSELPSAGLLLAGSGLASTAALRSSGPVATALGSVTGLALTAAAGATVRMAVGSGWGVPGYLLCAVAVLAVVSVGYGRGPLPRALALGLGIGAGVAGAPAVLWALPGLAAGVFGPLVTSGPVRFGPAPAVAVPVILAAAAGLPMPARLRGAARRGALVLGAVAAAVLPTALGLSSTVSVLLRVAVVAVLLLVPGRTAPAPAVVLAVTSVAWALGSWPLTFAVLGVLLGAFGGAAAVRTAPGVRAVAGAAAVACAAGLAWAGPVAAGSAAATASSGVLGVAAAAVALALSLRAAGLSPALECAGYGTAALAVALAGGDPAMLALVLGLAGVLAAAVALSADRRLPAGYTAAALMTAATWVRLAASGISVPEAYALPVSLAALAVGFLRRRRDPAASSWTAYAPGLAAVLVPSLLAAWADPHWPRPLLLGAAALAVTLLGARHRLQAPLVLGALVLSLDALHELAPYVLQAVGALPRWLPLALAGVLLLVVGGTYERRLREVRRVRDLLGRLG